MSDRVTGGDCSHDPQYPVRSLLSPYDRQGWTLLSTGSDEEHVTVYDEDFEERVVRSHALNYVDVSWDPYASQGGEGGSWRHTFALDSLAFVLRNGYADNVDAGDPPGDTDWFVPDDDEGTQIQESAVRIKGMENDPAISVRRGQNLVGFVDGEGFRDQLWSNEDDRGSQFAEAIQSGNWSAPDPGTEDLGELAADLEGQAELEEANDSLGSFVFSTALTLGIGAVNGPLAALVGVVQLMMAASNEPERTQESDLAPIAYNRGFEGVLDHAAPMQGHRVVFDVYAPRCERTSFAVESWFGKDDWSAKWNVPLEIPDGASGSCRDGDSPELAPSEVPLDSRFSTARVEESLSEGYGNDHASAQVSLLVESLDDAGRYALDASGTIAPNDPVPDEFEYRVYDDPGNFDPTGIPDGQLDEPLYEVESGGPTHCVTFRTPGSYVIEAKSRDGGGEAYRELTVSPDEFGEHTLTIESPTGSSKQYSLAVESNLQKSTANGASVNSGDSVISDTAAGKVGGGVDSYTFDGGVRFLKGEGVTFTLDGHELDPARHGPMHTLTIESPDDSHQNYSFEASGPIQKSTANGASTDPGDGIDGTVAAGYVREETDSYEFTGEIFDFEGDVDAYLNGEQIRSAGGQDSDVTISGPTSAYTGTKLTWGASLENFTGRPSFNWGEPVAEGDSYFDDGQSTSHTFSEPGTYEVTVSVSSDRGESASDTLEVTIEDEPSVDLQVDDPSVRTGDTVQFDVFTSGFDGSPTIRWQGVSASGGSAEVTWSDADTYTVEVTAVAGSQSATDSETVSVRSEPSVTIDGPSSANPGDDLTFDANVEHFRGNPDFNWMPPLAQGDSYFDDGATQTYTPGSAETFEAHVSVSSNEGESASDSLTVDVTEPYEPVSVDLSADDDSVQDGDQVHFDASASGGEGSIDYSWDGASGSGSTASRSWDSAGDHTVEVTASDGRSSDSASVTVSVREPSVSISGPSNVDEGDSVTYEANTTDFLGSPSFNWSQPLAQGDSYFDDGQRQSHHVSSGSDFTASVAVSSDEGESASASKDVDVDADTSSGGGYDGGSDDDGDDGSSSDSDDGSSGSTTDDTPTTNEDANMECARNLRYSECEQ